MGLFDSAPTSGGLFGDINERVTPFTQNNQMALLNAGMALMGGDGYQGAARGFAAGALADGQNRRLNLQEQLLKTKAQREQTLFDQGQEDRRRGQERVNKTQEFIEKNMPELIGAPREVQIAAFKEKFAGGSNRGSLVPVPGLDADGNLVYMQPRQDGSMVQFSTPDGVTPLSPYQKSYDKAQGTAAGKLSGEAEAKFKGAAPGLENSIRLVDEVINHPSLDDAVGPLQGRLPSFSAGARDFDERVEQLKGQAFLAARAELKGGGQITDFEGARAEAALLRASQAKGEEDFKQAMTEFRAALVRGYELLAEQAGQDGALPTSATQSESQTPTRRKYNPKTGELE